MALSNEISKWNRVFSPKRNATYKPKNRHFCLPCVSTRKFSKCLFSEWSSCLIFKLFHLRFLSSRFRFQFHMKVVKLIFTLRATIFYRNIIKFGFQREFQAILELAKNSRSERKFQMRKFVKFGFWEFFKLFRRSRICQSWKTKKGISRC